jgi:hypothetical protein
MSTVRANNYYDANGTSNATLYGVAAPTGSMGFRNRIINGDMRIDQRNAGAAVTTTAQYLVDRFNQAFGNASCSFQQVSDAPSGFTNSLRLTVTTGAAPSAGTNNVILQRIEGLNVADLAWGTASASSVTLSFWVKASVTGTYAVAFTNSAFNRSYVQTYVVNSANVWEQKTVTLSGDTAGTWLTTNGTGIVVLWDFGSGSNLNTTAGAWQAGNFYRTSACTTIAATTNATFAITGVQLEAGSVASPFERRDYGRELFMCQRYLYRISSNGTDGCVLSMGFANSSTQAFACIFLPVSLRAAPTLTWSGVTISDLVSYTKTASAVSISAAPATGINIFRLAATDSGLTTGAANQLGLSSSSASNITLSAEL